ncbi:ParB N-terminal domain-containing protein [Aeromonas hydrophila]|uniref:ParB N-terminal domain-containing protein n=1 Tax=Aeromonas hydrophila TaxID=644 RepID=UPI0009BA9258|nr:ParB N-terminal domain-containing protein [Aeromonas hydrophila]
MARINYQEWARINLSVSNIRLDRDNPRIPSYSAIRNQTDIISYMFENEKILRLAAKITDKGFICHDPIYVVKEGDYYTVVEGNRRVTALKCLIDPDLAPTVQARNRLSKHKNSLGVDLIEKIEVYVAPSRHDVENVLFELHAEGKLQWNRQQKNKFIAGVGINNGESVDDIAKRFNVAPSEISQAVTEYLIERYIPELSLPTDIESLALKQKLNISTLSRFINNSHFIEKTGFAVNNNKIITTASRDVFNYLLSKIIIDIIEKRIDSRTHNDSETIKKYIDTAIKNYSGPTDSPPVEYSPPLNRYNQTTTRTKRKKQKKKQRNSYPQKY